MVSNHVANGRSSGDTPRGNKRIVLSDRFITSRRPAAPGDRDDWPDAIVPGLLLRVTDRGHKSFVLRARYPLNPKNPTRRALGDYGAITLGEARDKARAWLELIHRGIDPKIEEERLRTEAKRRQDTTFGRVAADFLDRHAVKLAKVKEIRAIIEGEFVKRWRNRPIELLAPQDIAPAIRAIVDRGAPAQAHNAYANLRNLFGWAIGTGEYGITQSPLANLSPKSLIGERVIRRRILSDSELRAVWGASDRLLYPYGPAVRLLILTAQRLTQVSDLPRPEIDFDQALWSLSPERMKSDAPHLVPLAPLALDLLRLLPQWTRGEFVFTTTEGRKPVNGFSKAKERLDRLSGVTDWVLHDIRRTVRTHFSALPVTDIVRELVIGHAQKGLHRVYDLHSYIDEKRHCLELWEKRLMSIVEPPLENITKLTEARQQRWA
jgi:integrase